MRRRYERNVARFRVGQAWASGSRVYRILEGPVNHPLYVWDDDDGEDEIPPGRYEDRLALRVESLPLRDDAPDGGEWLDESVFPYLRLMHDPAPVTA
jgi:hypothetical protein